MADAILSNLSFKLTDVLIVGGMSVTISNDIERNLVIVADNCSVVLSNKSGSILERMKANFAGGVMTITKRGLDQSQTAVEVPALQREWRVNTEGYITVLAPDFVASNQPNNWTADQIFQQDISVAGDANLTTLNVSGNSELTNVDINGKFNGAVVADVTARNLLYPAPVAGDEVYVISLNAKQIYNSNTAQWDTQDVGTPPPMATETVAGIAELATNAESIDDTNDVTIMTPKKTKYKLDRYVITEELTAGEAMSANEGYRRGNTALNTPGDTNTLLPPANNFTTNIAIGYDTTLEKQGQSFTTLGGVISSVTTVNYKTGSPTGNLGCRIRATTSGAILDTSITTVAESSLGSTAGTATTSVFTFTGNVEVIPGTYYIEQFCDRANSTTNYSNWLATTLTIAGGTGFSISSTNVWTDITQDHKFSVTLTPYSEVNTKFYKAFNIANRSTILGLVKSSVVADATFTALKKGYVKGFTGLTVGSPVFLQADGTITQTITNKKLGEATASDTIYLDIDKQQESMIITRDLSLATGVVTYNHTLGEKPIFVTANYSWANSGTASISTGMGTYNGSTQLSNLASYNNGILSSANLITVGSTTAAYQTGLIQNITNTTFDISWTKVSTPTGTATIFLTLSL